MFLKLKDLFKGDRKYFSIVFFIVLLIIISGIITPIYISYIKSSWETEIVEYIDEIETSVQKQFRGSESLLFKKRNELKEKLKQALSPGNTSFRNIIEAVNSPAFSRVSAEVIAPNGKIIAWNSDPAIPQDDIFPLAFPAGESFFYNSGLMIYLSVLDTLHIDADKFYFIVSLPFEKKYTLQNEYYKEISFINEISSESLTSFEMDFTPYAVKTRDGRKYSFDILNNSKNKIAVVTFTKPAVISAENLIYGNVSVLQSFLALLAFLVAGMGFRKEYHRQSSPVIRLLLFTLYITAFRVLLFATDFPARLVEGPLTDPVNFSSAFGWGIVKSPFDLFLTVLFFLLISIQAFRTLAGYIDENNENRNRSILLFGIVVPASAFLFFVTLRGLSASLKSIILDSSLRYFKDPDIIPEATVLFILVTVLMLATAVVLFLSSFMITAFRFIPGDGRKRFRIYTLIILLVYTAVCIVYIVTQRNPLITIFAAILYLVIIWIFIYRVYPAGIKSVFNYVYAALIGSALSITLLNLYNVDLEQESLKTTASAINRPDESLIRFLITEALISSVQNTEIQDVFLHSGSNYYAAAFRIWSGSALQRETLNSAVIIYDTKREMLGKFSAGITGEPDSADIFRDIKEGIPGINKLPGEASGEYYAGILPMVINGYTRGYIAALVQFNLKSLALTGIPDFLESGGRSINPVIDPGKLKIFQFEGDELISVYGDIYPSRDLIKPILESVSGESSDAWLSLSFNDEEYKTFVQRAGSTVTAVSLRENHFSWRLFNFFKIFIIHSAIILALYIILYTFTVRRIKYSFRMQLLVAFVVISVFPVILLALYNRQLVTERSTNAVVNELNERAQYLESHIAFQLNKHPQRELNTAFVNAGEELSVSFSIYRNSNLEYSSESSYYRAGLFPYKINPEAYYHLNYLNFREYITSEKVDRFAYNSFYKRITIENDYYTLCVNDAFNSINISLAASEFDTFLFGVYSLAVLIIIIISTVLANKISSPIRKLTNATGSVAHGDLNVRITNNERGEIKELIEGFNSMTEELQKNEIEMAQLERENAWKEMAKQVAHEIKNPLTPMKLAVQQLVISFSDKSRNFDDVFERVTSTLLNQIENLNQIASEFSRFARMPKFKMEQVDLFETINDTVNLFLDEKIIIKVNTSLIKAPAESDRGQTRRMIINLIRNSIQADASEINIELIKEGEMFHLSFSDNGRGIPPEVKERIFEPEFTTKEKGMGIGLKISRRYLESIGGEIILENTSDKGTSFLIKIPASSNGEKV